MSEKQRWLLVVLAALVGGIAGNLWLGQWARAPLPPSAPALWPEAPLDEPSLARAALEQDEVDPEAWRVTLWQPLREPPPPPPPPPAPVSPPPLTLFSVVAQGGSLVAVLDAGDQGLLYVKGGEEHGPYRIEAVEAESVSLQYRGKSFRLELTP